MIDIQFVAIPETKNLVNDENNKTVWFSIENLDSEENISDEIKNKVKLLYDRFKNS